MHLIAKSFGQTAFFPYDDVAVMSYCLDSSEHSHDLNTLASLFFEETLPSLDDMLGTGKSRQSFNSIEETQALEYLCSQADYTLRLQIFLRRRLLDEKRTRVYEVFDRPLLQTLYNMETRGVKVNAQELTELSRYFD